MVAGIEAKVKIDRLAITTYTFDTFLLVCLYGRRAFNCFENRHAYFA